MDTSFDTALGRALAAKERELFDKGLATGAACRKRLVETLVDELKQSDVTPPYRFSKLIDPTTGLIDPRKRSEDICRSDANLAWGFAFSAHDFLFRSLSRLVDEVFEVEEKAARKAEEERQAREAQARAKEALRLAEEGRQRLKDQDIRPGQNYGDTYRTTALPGAKESDLDGHPGSDNQMCCALQVRPEMERDVQFPADAQNHQDIPLQPPASVGGAETQRLDHGMSDNHTGSVGPLPTSFIQPTQLPARQAQGAYSKPSGSVKWDPETQRKGIGVAKLTAFDTCIIDGRKMRHWLPSEMRRFSRYRPVECEIMDKLLLEANIDHIDPSRENTIAYYLKDREKEAASWIEDICHKHGLNPSRYLGGLNVQFS